MIDENKLLKDLKEASECKRIDNSPSDYFKLSELEFLISMQEKIETNRWIPVSERLPDNEPCYISGTDYYVTTINNRVRSAKYKEGKWLGAFGKVFCDKEIIAWKLNLLPKPYQGE